MNHRAEPLGSDWPTRPHCAPQGRIDQGWPVRRCSPEPVFMDRMPEDYDQTDSADGDVWRWLLKGFVVVGVVLFCAWVIAGGPNA